MALRASGLQENLSFDKNMDRSGEIPVISARSSRIPIPVADRQSASYQSGCNHAEFGSGCELLHDHTLFAIRPSTDSIVLPFSHRYVRPSREKIGFTTYLSICGCSSRRNTQATDSDGPGTSHNSGNNVLLEIMLFRAGSSQRTPASSSARKTSRAA